MPQGISGSEAAAAGVLISRSFCVRSVMSGRTNSLEGMLCSQRTFRSVSTRSTSGADASVASAMWTRAAEISMTTACTDGRSRTTLQPALEASARHSSMVEPSLQVTMRRSVSPNGQNWACALAAEKIRTRARARDGVMGLLLRCVWADSPILAGTFGPHQGLWS
ncbi:MAG: hypothetical protein A2506_08685 [Elusimicrobia bacterium RIFOXYD12_FULL_66_9]|nr:MAG: hypothetical protein A2506_08685 [Elusimicrobia bacterium RIFOXYD12_FULL_66_9]